MKKNSDIFIHPTAVVDQGAKISSGAKIWHFSHIFKGAQIGKDCKIGQNVVVHGTVTMGNNVKVQNNVSIYDGVTLEDNVFCGPSCVFTNIFNPRSSVTRNSAEHYRKTIVRRDATIGANATILCGIEIGQFAFIGAGAVVTRNVPDYALVYGNPAKQNGWMCQCGEKIKLLRGKLFCSACGLKYKKVKSGLMVIS